jgi:hypothetical protein
LHQTKFLAKLPEKLADEVVASTGNSYHVYGGLVVTLSSGFNPQKRWALSSCATGGNTTANTYSFLLTAIQHTEEQTPNAQKQPK